MPNKFRRSPIHRVRHVVRKLWTDQSGGEVIEWVLIAGLISITAIAVIATVGTKVLGRWNTINSSM